MSFEGNLNSHLATDSAISQLVSGGDASPRIWPLLRPESNETLPAITITVVSGDPATDLDGLDGKLMNYRVQIDIWAKGPRGYDEARTLAELVRIRMQTPASSFASVPLPGSGTDGYEPETRIFRVTWEFSCWYRVPD